MAGVGSTGGGRVVSEDEMILIDAAARLGGPQERLQCARCGGTFRAGRGHLGSALCVVARSKAELAKIGFVPIDEWSWAPYFETAGVEIRSAPGRLDTRRGSGLTRARVLDRKFSPRWAVRYMRATMGVDQRVRLRVLVQIVAGKHEAIRAGLSAPRGAKWFDTIRDDLARARDAARAEIRAERRPE